MPKPKVQPLVLRSGTPKQSLTRRKKSLPNAPLNLIERRARSRSKSKTRKILGRGKNRVSKIKTPNNNSNSRVPNVQFNEEEAKEVLQEIKEAVKRKGIPREIRYSFERAIKMEEEIGRSTTTQEVVDEFKARVSEIYTKFGKYL